MWHLCWNFKYQKGKVKKKEPKSLIDRPTRTVHFFFSQLVLYCFFFWGFDIYWIINKDSGFVIQIFNSSGKKNQMNIGPLIWAYNQEFSNSDISVNQVNQLVLISERLPHYFIVKFFLQIKYIGIWNTMTILYSWLNYIYT